MVQKSTPNWSSSLRARPAKMWPTSWAHSKAGTGGSLTMAGSTECLAPGSGLEFLAALPPGCHPWPWDEAAGGSWKKTERGKEWLFSQGRWGQKGQAYWTGFEEPEIAKHSQVFVSYGFSPDDCVSQPVTRSLFLHCAFFGPTAPTTQLNLSFGHLILGQATLKHS